MLPKLLNGCPTLSYRTETSKIVASLRLARPNTIVLAQFALISMRISVAVYS